MKCCNCRSPWNAAIQRAITHRHGIPLTPQVDPDIIGKLMIPGFVIKSWPLMMC